MYRSSHGGKVGSNVVLEAVLANVVQQLLHFWNFNHSRAAKGIQRIVCKTTFAYIATYLAGSIIRRKAREAHLLRLDKSNHGALCVFLADRAGDDFLEVHLERPEEMFRQISAVKANCLIGISPVIVIPIKQG